tara:strand:- start:567 stop:1436 length:870 start_codon:yes stop_codon:yes gene_type:complete
MINSPTTLLHLNNVAKEFRSRSLFDKSSLRAVDTISLTIDENAPKITALAGESGSGKTTLGKLILGLLPPSEGEIYYKSKPIDKLSSPDKKQYRRDIQAIFQDPFAVYNPFYKVDHLFEAPLKKFHITNTKDETRQLIEESIETVGLRASETLGRYPHQLSGGQRQRIMVARALMIQPKIIVADEPVSMVDASLRATILEALRTIHEKQNISMIYITHDLNTAYQVAEDIKIMYQGKVVEEGDVDTVINNPKHPYTQLLINCIPKPDPKEKWIEKEKLSALIANLDSHL